MAKVSEQFRQSDVTAWAVVALVTLAAAVLLGNIAGALPPETLSGLHASRLGGATSEQLRRTVGDLEAEIVRMRRENDLLLARFTQAEQTGADAARRVAAIEVSLPRLVEQMHAMRPGVDASLPTASIEIPERNVVPVAGGSMVVETSPLSPVPIAEQPIPAPLASGAGQPTAPISRDEFGIAVGSPTGDTDAQAAWDDLLIKLGPLLLGFTPLLAEAADGNGFRIIAGPTADLAEATALCGRLERIAIACEPVPYRGQPLS